MITNFEAITESLPHDEYIVLQPLIKSLSRRGKDNPIKAPEIVKAINEKLNTKTKFTEVKLRKMCNFIRTQGMLPLIATSDGYYCSYDRDEIEKQIRSLNERASAILASANGLSKFIKPKI